MPSESSKSPLRRLLQQNGSEEEVLALVDAVSAMEKDEYGWLPLHAAAGYNASDAVVVALLAAYPNAAKEKDNEYGYLPLHNALFLSA